MLGIVNKKNIFVEFHFKCGKEKMSDSEMVQKKKNQRRWSGKALLALEAKLKGMRPSSYLGGRIFQVEGTSKFQDLRWECARGFKKSKQATVTEAESRRRGQRQKRGPVF